jgi:hypothetical protein
VRTYRCRGIALSGLNADATSIIQLGGVVRLEQQSPKHFLENPAHRTGRLPDQVRDQGALEARHRDSESHGPPPRASAVVSFVLAVSATDGPNLKLKVHILLCEIVSLCRRRKCIILESPPRPLAFIGDRECCAPA